MSAYKGHRGPNVSQYIANLNQLSPPQELLNDSPPGDDDFSAFLNADFFDINNGPAANFDAHVDLDIGLDAESEPAASLEGLSRKQSVHALEASMDFNLNGDFHFTDFNNFGPGAILDPAIQSLPQPNHYPLPQQNFTSPTSSISSTNQAFDQASKKRKLDVLDVGAPIAQPSLDEGVRVAAEEDKRRRNTAASARFRVKKKQREQALEKTAKEMGEKVNILEAKVQQLETENAWLKSLITEKSGGKHTTNDLKALLVKHEQEAGRSSPAHTDGVGTKA